MAPKRRGGGKVVGSVVKTKVVQETVEVTTAVIADGEPEQRGAEALALAPPAVDVSGGSRRVVHIEVTTPDGDATTGGSNAKKQATSKRGRRGGRREEEEKPAPPAEEAAQEPPVAQSQETQDPNEEQEEEVEEDASKKKRKPPPPQERQDEEPPETPRVASERKAAAAKTTPQQQKKRGGGDKARAKKGGQRRRRLGEASPGGDAGMGGVGGYKRYVWRVLKQVHPELGLSGLAMRVLDMMMADMFERLADEAARLSKASGRATLSAREVQSAVRLALPGELGRHAMSEGTKAISKYMSYDA